MTEPAFTLDEIEHRSLCLADEIDDEFSRRCIRLHIKKQLKNVVPDACIAQLSLLMVDDGPEEIGKYLPHLVALTRGQVKPVLYLGQGAETLTQTIRQTTAQVALMDYTMKPEQGVPLCGSDVVQTLRSAGLQKTFIGFSGNDDVSKHFLASGAAGFVSKSIDPSRTMPELLRTLLSLHHENA